MKEAEGIEILEKEYKKSNFIEFRLNSDKKG
jgi:hypothetical protein